MDHWNSENLETLINHFLNLVSATKSIRFAKLADNFTDLNFKSEI